MKFSEYKYVRPDFEQIEKEINELINKFNASESKDEQIKCIDRFNEIRNYFDTMSTLTSIRNSINTTDEFYEKEQEFFDEKTPVYGGLVDAFLKSLVKSKFKNELEEKYGKYFFEKIELQLKVFSPDIIEDLVAENKLVTKYSKLTASAKIEFDGKINNLSQMTPYSQSTNRGIREKAQLLVAKFFEDNEHEFDTIYDELVKVRTKMAKKLGFNNYVELGYGRLGRTDYTSADVKKYRDQVYKYLVPLAQKLIDRQANRLGLETLKYFDLNLKFLSGNPKPIGSKDVLVAKGKQMYSEMSPETKEFFDFMVEKELLDLEAKEGKRGGGYCTFISDYKSPFIFSNFNGTSGDVDVLTHEAGHAFQVFQSRNIEIPEFIWPTYEACEIHSMSMEFFAWPWMNLFFGHDEEKYRYTHLSEALLFIPYGVTVDEFQHYVYENPDATPEMRKAMWRQIEKKYLPYKVYDGNKFFERGGFWFRQSHIFSSPFYYIDYTLAQVCAFQYLIASRENRPEAWNSYLGLCKLGGTKPFLELVEAAGLLSPFTEGTLEKIVLKVSTYLDEIDDSKL